MKFKNILLFLGALLVAIGLLKPDFNQLIPTNHNNDNVMIIEAPQDTTLKKEAEEMILLLKSFGKDSKDDSLKLRNLYLDLATLVELDGENQVVKNTEEIRQANSLAGVMLRLDIKNKYTNLAKEAKDVIVAAIGDDQVLLSPELRAKAVEGFKALAWACNEVNK